MEVHNEQKEEGEERKKKVKLEEFCKVKQQEASQEEEQRMKRRRQHKPPHAVEGCAKVLLAEHVMLPQQQALLQRHRHRRAVLRTLTARQTNAVHRSTHLDKWLLSVPV